jgi:hypothetical protein
VGDFVTSMRKHRDESHRVRIFSEFAGVDIRRPQKALSLHIMVVHQVRKPSLRCTLSDRQQIWCSYQYPQHAPEANIPLRCSNTLPQGNTPTRENSPPKKGPRPLSRPSKRHAGSKRCIAPFGGAATLDAHSALIPRLLSQTSVA